MNFDLEIEKHKQQIKDIKKLKRMMKLEGKLLCKVYKPPVRNIFELWIGSIFDFILAIISLLRKDKNEKRN